MTTKEKEAWKEIALGIIFIVFGIAVYIVSQDIPGVKYDLLGPAFMPRFLGIVCALISCGIFFNGVRKKLRAAKEKEPEGEQKKPLPYKTHSKAAFFSICLFFLYILALDLGISGFRTLTTIFVLVLGGVLINISNTKGKIKYFIILVFLALTLSFGLYYLFTRVFVVNLY